MAKSLNGGATEGQIANYATKAGVFKPMLANHTKHFDLAEGLSNGVERIQRSCGPLRERIDFMRNKVPT